MTCTIFNIVEIIVENETNPVICLKKKEMYIDFILFFYFLNEIQK